MTIQIKAIEQYFPVVLFVLLYSVVPSSVKIHMIGIEQYFPIFPFVLQYIVVPTFQLVNGAVTDYQSNENS